MNKHAHLLTILLGIALAALVTVPANAFFDEVAELKQELIVWETAQAADLSDVVDQLEDITGSVFSDVDPSAWYHSYVSFLADARIVSGEKDASGRTTGLFRPSRNVTVAETLKMALEAARVQTDSCGALTHHTEVASHWAKTYVACAEGLKMRLTDSTISLALDRQASRGEVTAIVNDAFGDRVPPLIADFTDVHGTPYEADIAYLQLLGVVSGDVRQGKATGTFRPRDFINRAEVAKIVYERMKLEARRALASAQ